MVSYAYLLSFISFCSGKFFEKNNTNLYMSFMKIIYLLIVFLVILGTSYYFSKFIARKNFGKNKIMKLIETLPLGYDKNIHIIKIGEEFFLVSSTQKNINLLDRLSKNDLNNMIQTNKINDKHKKHDTRYEIDEYNYDKQENSQSNIMNNITKIMNYFRGRNIND